MAKVGWSTWFKSLVFCGLALALTGCPTASDRATVSQGSSLSEAPLSLQFNVPTLLAQNQTLTEVKLDAPAQRVVRAVEARLRGYDAQRVLRDLAVRIPEDLPNLGATLAGLDLGQVLLTPDAAPSGSSAAQSLAGVLRFGDSIGRSLDVGFSSSYSQIEAAVEVVALSLSPIVDPAPSVELFTVPVARIDQVLVNAAESYDALHRAVEARAITMTDPTSAPKGRQDYAFVAFLKAPLASDATLQVLFGQGRQLSAGDASKSSYRAFEGGWVVALVHTELDLIGDPAHWIAVVLDPSGEEQAARVIGLYSTRPGRAAQQSSQRTAAAGSAP